MEEIDIINIEEEEKDVNVQGKSGIGGWLVVLLVYICLCLVSALYNSIGTFVQKYVTFSAIVCTVLIVVFIIMIVGFARKRYYFVKMANVTFVLLAIYNFIMFFISIVSISNYAYMLPQVYKILLFAPLIDVALMILWVVYLNKSDRVYNTFRDNAEDYS